MYLVLLKMMISDPCTDWFARLRDLFYQLFHFARCRTLFGVYGSRLARRTIGSPTERPRESLYCCCAAQRLARPRCAELAILDVTVWASLEADYTVPARRSGGCLGATPVSAEVSLKRSTAPLRWMDGWTRRKTLTPRACLGSERREPKMCRLVITLDDTDNCVS